MSGSSGSAMREKVRALDFDNSINTVVTLDSLAEVEDGEKGESEWKEMWYCSDFKHSGETVFVYRCSRMRRPMTNCSMGLSSQIFP